MKFGIRCRSCHFDELTYLFTDSFVKIHRRDLYYRWIIRLGPARNLYTNWGNNYSLSDNWSVYKYRQADGSFVQTSYLDSSWMKTNYPAIPCLDGWSVCLPSLRPIIRRTIVVCPIGPLQDLVTFYSKNYAGTQMTQWDFQNKGKSDWTGKSSLFWKAHCVICVSV